MQLWHITSLELLEALDIVICLCEAGELVRRGEVFVGEGRVYRVREEYLIVDVDVLLNILVRIERSQLALNDGRGPLDGSFDEVLVYFELRAFLLHPLEV